MALQAKLLVEVEQEVREKIRAQTSLRGESRKRGAAECPDELQWSRRMAKRNSAVPVASSEDCEESRKRSPQAATEALKLDIDDLVIKAIEESQVATSSSSSSTDVAMASADAVDLVRESVLSEEKPEKSDSVASCVMNEFAARSADVSTAELRNIVEFGLEMSAFDLSTVEHPVRFYVIAPNMGFRTRFVLDLRAGWNVMDEYHMQELKKFTQEQETYLLIRRGCRGFDQMCQGREQVILT